MITLHNGDCLDILPTLPEKCVDAIITDLPYGTTACAWDSIIPFEPMWKQVKRLLKPHGVFVTTASQPFTSALVMSNLQWFKYEWIFEKTRITGYLDANRRPMKSHENIVVFGNGILYNPQMTKGENHKSGAKPEWKGQAKVYGKHDRILTQSNLWYPRSIIRFSADPDTTVTRKQRPNKIERHPTQKPVALYEYLIRTYTNEGDMVLDFCFGSCTTGVACVNTGRNFIGIEKDTGYFGIGQKRIAEAETQIPMLVG
jgi:DNA modification methylase